MTSNAPPSASVMVRLSKGRQLADSQVSAIVNLVAAGLGVSIVPASMQQANIEGVTYRPIRKPAPKARLSLLYRRDDADSPHLQNLLELTRQLVRASKRA